MELPSNLKLLIFDFDGTLFYLDDMDWGALRAKLVRDDEKLGHAMQRLHRARDPLLQHVTDAELQSVGDRRVAPEIIDALSKLATRYSLAILSRNSRLAIEHAFADTALQDQLYIVGREDVDELKPHPQGAQHILEHFGAQPSQAALVGDTYHDIQAARAAGITSIIVHNERLAYAPEGADRYIQDISELIPLLIKT